MNAETWHKINDVYLPIIALIVFVGAIIVVLKAYDDTNQ